MRRVPVVLPAIAQAGKEVVTEDARRAVLPQQLRYRLPKTPEGSWQRSGCSVVGPSRAARRRAAWGCSAAQQAQQRHAGAAGAAAA